MLPLFGFEGMVWQDEARTMPLGGDYYIRCINKRNNKWDADALGVSEGTFPSAGHYSLCLADFKSEASVANAGDEIEFYLFKRVDDNKRLCELESFIVSEEDIKRGGVALDFIVKGVTL